MLIYLLGFVNAYTINCLFSLQSFFAERFFHLFDKDGSGTISLKELMDGLTLLTHGTEVDKLKFLFEVYDVDGMLCYIQSLKLIHKKRYAHNKQTHHFNTSVLYCYVCLRLFIDLVFAALKLIFVLIFSCIEWMKLYC